jgi:hypothetical protein
MSLTSRNSRRPVPVGIKQAWTDRMAIRVGTGGVLFHHRERRGRRARKGRGSDPREVKEDNSVWIRPRFVPSLSLRTLRSLW